MQMFIASKYQFVETEADQYGPALWAMEIGHEECGPSLDSRIGGLRFLQLHK